MKAVLVWFVSMMSMGPILSLASEQPLSASIGPHIENEETIGFEFNKIQPNSEWAKDGLKDKDIVLSVNSKLTKEFGTSTIDFVSSMHISKHINLLIERQGKRQNLSFDNQKN